MPEIDPSAYGYAKDNDPDNPENYHAPDEETPFGSLARGEPVSSGLKWNFPFFILKNFNFSANIFFLFIPIRIFLQLQFVFLFQF